MSEVFADAVYWIGLLNPNDRWHNSAVRSADQLDDVTIVTTEGVLSEVLAFVTRLDTHFRRDAVELVMSLQLSSAHIILPQTHDLFQRGVELYERRTASTLSLQDCISMIVMRDRGITDVLTGDAEFRGFGFNLLLQR